MGDVIENGISSTFSSEPQAQATSSTKKEKEPRLCTCWEDVCHEPEPGSEVKFNGLFDSGAGSFVPEEIMELCLSYVDLNTLLSVAQVCRKWKNICTTPMFWKRVCSRNGVNYDNDIPSHVRAKPNAWIAIWTICRYKFLGRNLILNHSGKAGSASPLLNWEIKESDPVLVEPFPVRGIPLPPNPFFGNNTNCMAVSARLTRITSVLNLASLGLNISVLKLLSPFTLDFSVLVGIPTQSAGYGGLKITTYDKESWSLLFETEQTSILMPGSGWEEKMISVYFSNETDDGLMDSTHKIEFQLSGKGLVVGAQGLEEIPVNEEEPEHDGQFWGTKFARSCARINIIHDPDGYVRPEHCIVYNEAVIIERYGLNEPLEDMSIYDDYPSDDDE